MRVSRRQVLSMTGGAALFAGSTGFATRAVAAPSLIRLRKLAVRTLSFDCTNAGERLIGVDYWVEGEYVPGALSEINRALRDYRTDEVYPISTDLLDLLYQLGNFLETDCRFELTSGYRSPETN